MYIIHTYIWVLYVHKYIHMCVYMVCARIHITEKISTACYCPWRKWQRDVSLNHCYIFEIWIKLAFKVVSSVMLAIYGACMARGILSPKSAPSGSSVMKFRFLHVSAAHGWQREVRRRILKIQTECSQWQLKIIEVRPCMSSCMGRERIVSSSFIWWSIMPVVAKTYLLHVSKWVRALMRFETYCWGTLPKS